MDRRPDDITAALAPIASLLSKSEKAQTKVAPGTWQHTMLGENVAALQLALALMDPCATGAPDFSPEDLQAAAKALASMIDRTENTRTKFAPGTSQHTLQRNRLAALKAAADAVQAELAKPKEGRS